MCDNLFASLPDRFLAYDGASCYLGFAMLRTHWLTSSAAAKAYFKQSDYYASCPSEWLGKGAAMLGLHGPARGDDFDRLCDSIDPRSGLPLRPLARADGRIGMDLTFNSVKSVGIARELAGPGCVGDPRIDEPVQQREKQHARA